MASKAGVVHPQVARSVGQGPLAKTSVRVGHSTRDLHQATLPKAPHLASAVVNTSATGNALPWLRMTVAGVEIWVLSKYSETAPVTSTSSPN